MRSHVTREGEGVGREGATGPVAIDGVGRREGEDVVEGRERGEAAQARRVSGERVFARAPTSNDRQRCSKLYASCLSHHILSHRSIGLHS